MGLVPLFVTARGNLGVTAALASVTLCFMIGGAIYKNGFVGFLKCFTPPGIPWPILIMLTPLEVLGIFIRTFALTIRLFANMLAGHIVIFSLLGLVYMFGWVAVPALALAVGVYLLELMIAFLQAFIFTLLSAIFMGLLYHPAH
jgi:F-type H+-transporting ATPase subunit a